MAAKTDIYLPTLHYFAMNNPFTGSYGLLRFRIVPTVVMLNQKEVNMAESSIHAEVWHGIFCYACSSVEDEQTFDMSAEGRDAMQQWLFDHIPEPKEPKAVQSPSSAAPEE